MVRDANARAKRYPSDTRYTGALEAAQEGAQAALGIVDSAQTRIQDYRSSLGAQQNGFEQAISTREIAIENTQASESRIRDLDYARQSIEQARNQILLQANISVLAQANLNGQRAGGLLSL